MRTFNELTQTLFSPSSLTTTPSARSQRDTLIQQFLLPLNAARSSENLRRFIFARKMNPTLTKDSFKKSREYLRPYSPARLNMRLAHLNIPDLYYFLSVCNHSKTFSKTFEWELKAR